MSAAGRNWTTQELELYHDDACDLATREALTDALRRSPPLRERLAAVRRVDELTLRALLSADETGPARATRAVRRRAPHPAWIGVGLAAAAGLGLAAIGWWRSIRDVESPDSGRIVRMNTSGDRSGGSALEGALKYQAIRVVATIPVRPREAGTTGADPGRRLAAAEHAANPLSRSGSGQAERSRVLAEQRAAVRTALARGRVDDVLAWLDAAQRDERGAMLEEIGEVLRSGVVAERVLDQLEPDEQLIVCARWAYEPPLRQVIFRRLQQLAQEPELKGPTVRLARELARDPELRPWLRSYPVMRPLTGEPHNSG